MLINPKDIVNGCKVFDAEHATLVNLINAIHLLLKEGKRASATELFKDGLVKYTEKHLAHEEAVMEKFGYPELPQHKRVHDIFKKIIAEDLAKLEDAKLFAAEAALAMGWVFGHIKKVDKKYVDFFRQKGCLEEACEELEQPIELGIEEKLKEILGDAYFDPAVTKDEGKKDLSLENFFKRLF